MLCFSILNAINFVKPSELGRGDDGGGRTWRWRRRPVAGITRGLLLRELGGNCAEVQCVKLSILLLFLSLVCASLFASHHLVLWWPRCCGCCGALFNWLLLSGSMQTMTAIIMGFQTSLENDQLSRDGALLLAFTELP